MRRDIEIVPSQDAFSQNVARWVWQEKYRYSIDGRPIDRTLEETWARVAKGLAQAEQPGMRLRHAETFRSAMNGFALLPAGRILAGCGTQRAVTLSNTFVMQAIPDSVEGIMETAKQAALTMKMGGGLGYDFSTIRPKGTYVKGLDCAAAGPLAAMDIFDSVCAMVVKGMGRGAMMATLRCDHPDVIDFVNAKTDRSKLRNFNLSVMVTDAFMAAVAADQEWPLLWQGVPVRTIQARELWRTIMARTHEAAEPGVLFIDRINALNPLSYLEEIHATNSCAEQPLPPNGTCPLASVNMAKLVREPFTRDAWLDFEEMSRLVSVAVRMLDNALDISKFANEAQRQEALTKRRIGIGVTGVADALIMMRLPYGAPRAAQALGSWMRCLQNAAYAASAKLAAERGPFPAFDPLRHHATPMIARLDPEVRQLVLRNGLRNGTLTSVAPTGTISMLAGNVSSGIEPVFSLSYDRTLTMPNGTKRVERVEDYAVWLFRRMFGPSATLPPTFVTTKDLSPEAHVVMQAAAQHWVDGGISKTVNCPEDIPFDSFEHIYQLAHDSGCKGCTTFRPNPITGSVLSEVTSETQGADWSPTHRHKKGGLYRVISEGIGEATRSPVVIYDDADGQVWVRDAAEFHDGRFRSLSAQPA